MLKILKRILCQHPKLKFYLQLLYAWMCPIRGKNNQVINKGCLIRAKFDIVGCNNRIYIQKGAILKNVLFHVRGNNHVIIIGENCRIIEGVEFWCEGLENIIEIGKATTIVSAHLCVQEEKGKIFIDEDCMLSNNILIRTSDSHPLYDMHTSKRINLPASVCIGKHVWICAKASILKGVHIGDGSVVGYASLITADVESNCLIVGCPGRIVRKDISWKRSFVD